MDLEKIINHDIQKLKSSILPNPLYGQNIFFYPECVGPNVERNQMMGYLGSFVGFNKLSNDIDICVIPKESFENLSKGNIDAVIEDLFNKLKPKVKGSNRAEVSHESILFLPEMCLFNYISRNLLHDDHVRDEQFNRINFSYKIS